LFYEYLHGDNGAGIGASHQTGWTGLVAGLLGFVSTVKPQQILEDTGGTGSGARPPKPPAGQQHLGR
jgi:hypothetical protein